MAENVTAGEDIGNEVVAVRPQLIVEGETNLLAGDGNETSNGCGQNVIQKREQELPELIRHKDESKITAPCMPYINLSELATILRDPSMPSQKILKEVADKIMLKSEESESDDGSVSSGGGVVGMRGLLDCIFEVSFWHEDSASSDDDSSYKRVPQKIPCKFCNKTFRSTMKRNTHVLVVHAEQDSSVLNIRRLSANEADRKEKSHDQKKHTRCMPKSDCDAKDAKTHHSSAAERKHNTLQSENTPMRKRRSSFSKSLSKEENAGKSAKYPSDACQKKKESMPHESSSRTQSSGLVASEKGDRIVRQKEIVESISAGETDNCPMETKCRESVNRDDATQPAQAPCSDKCSDKRSDDTEKQQTIGTRIDAVDAPSASKIDVRQSASRSGRKRKSASPVEESVSSPCASSNPKCSKKNSQKKNASLSEHIQSGSSPNEGAPNEGRLRSRAGKAATLRSFRRL